MKKFSLYSIILLIAISAAYILQNNEGDVNGCQANKYEALAEKSIGKMAGFQAFANPQPLPEINFKNENGEPDSVQNKKGKVVLLNLWATWCAPCREEMPSLEALQKTKGGEKFAVLPISIDRGSVEKITKFYDELKLQALPIAHDSTLAAFSSLQKIGLAFGLPATLLVDENSCVVGALNGPAEWNSSAAHEILSVMGVANGDS